MVVHQEGEMPSEGHEMQENSYSDDVYEEYSEDDCDVEMIDLSNGSGTDTRQP